MPAWEELEAAVLAIPLNGSILLTGGAGTLGRALVARAAREKWDARFTVYSRDPARQQVMRREFPACRFVVGDVTEREALIQAAAGHNAIIHLAAQKHIPEAERFPAHAWRVNVEGSHNVLLAALAVNVRQVVAVSTDKACHPVNVYGATKFVMEREWQQFALTFTDIQVNLCRYGNVVGSTGSVIPLWREQTAKGAPLSITDPDMTRFWLTVEQAVDIVLAAAREPSGTIHIPTPPALSMDKLARYLFPDSVQQFIGLRPGEKLHEELLTESESPFAERLDGHFRLWPVTGAPRSTERLSYTSDRARELSRNTLIAMLENNQEKKNV